MRLHPQVAEADGMIRSTPLPRLKVVDLNPFLSCLLCGGYYIDATTITECLHSFCRACIVRYLETSKYCPVCEVQVHKSRPLRSDKILQDIVYKLVPGLFHNEMKRRRELYASQPPEALKESRDSEDRGECLDEKFIYAPDEIFSLSIEYSKNKITDSRHDSNIIPKKRFLRCPAAVTISHLKKFIRMKYGIPNSFEIDLRYDKEFLLDEYTLMDVAYIFLWQRKGPMKFNYKILDRPPKRFMPEQLVSKNEKTEVNPVTVEGKDTTCDKLLNSAETQPAAPVQAVAPQVQVAVSAAETPTPTSLSTDSTVASDSPGDTNCKTPVETACSSRTESSVTTQAITEKKDKNPSDGSLTITICKRESKSIPFKFPSSIKSSASENKPAVMTVAPLTKPSSTLPTTSTTPVTTPVTGTITHGLYTGISIKKSPPNTLPPFKISSHLLPPKVPPLKLSPPRFSKLESCLRELSSSKKSSSKKSKSKNSIDKLELKVAQLKSASIKCVAPLVISVPQEQKLDSRKESPPKSPENQDSASPRVPVDEPKGKDSVADVKANSDEEKSDVDNDLYEGRLVIAEPDISKDDSDTSDNKSADAPKRSAKEEDSEDEEIDVVDDGEFDSGRGSDISSRAEARSLCGDDDLGSPDSVPKTPETDRNPLITESNHSAPEPASLSPKYNGVSAKNTNGISNGGDCGVLDLSTCGRKRVHDEDTPVHRVKKVANPAVLDKTRQTTTPCVSPNPSHFKVMAPEIPQVPMYKMKHESSRGSFKCRGKTLTVINPDPDASRPKIVIRTLGPRQDRGSERFHHHHHSHHHHHQRM